jgi:SAM-dependent methyltransferase
VIGKFARRAYQAMPDHVREDLRAKRAEFRGLGQMKDNQRLLALRLDAVERKLGMYTDTHVPVVDPRFPAGVSSRLCTQSEMEQPWYAGWCAALGIEPLAHRKVWEFAYIAEMMERNGMLGEGRRGIGFGVGREPLISGFAAKGASVLATDLAPDDREAFGWVKSDQHASDVDGLLKPGVCDPERFRELVSFRPVDMRAVPADLQGFDFCWSTCAFEHLGSLEAGLDFVEASVRTLRPGGIAVHTTEFNLGSDDETLTTGPTVVYRERDIRAFRDRMEAQGHEVAALDLYQGTGLLDSYVDVPPYAEEPVLRFTLAGFRLTSIGLVIRAGEGRAR